MNANGDIAKIFKDMALFYDMQDDRFRVRAYENGAEILESLASGVEEIYKEEGLKGLEDLEGVGRGMAEKIREYIQTGKIKEHEALKKKTPEAVQLALAEMPVQTTTNYEECLACQ